MNHYRPFCQRPPRDGSPQHSRFFRPHHQLPQHYQHQGPSHHCHRHEHHRHRYHHPYQAHPHHRHQYPQSHGAPYQTFLPPSPALPTGPQPAFYRGPSVSPHSGPPPPNCPPSLSHPCAAGMSSLALSPSTITNYPQPSGQCDPHRHCEQSSNKHSRPQSQHPQSRHEQRQAICDRDTTSSDVHHRASSHCQTGSERVPATCNRSIDTGGGNQENTGREQNSSSKEFRTSGSSKQAAEKNGNGSDQSKKDQSAAKGGNKKERQRQRAKELFDQEMHQRTTEMFPDLPNTTIHLPPQRFNKMHTTWDKTLGLHVQHASNISDVGSDRAESDVKRCLETIRDVTGEPMCVIFNYSFDNYLERKGVSPSKAKTTQSVGCSPSKKPASLHRNVNFVADNNVVSPGDVASPFQTEMSSFKAENSESGVHVDAVRNRTVEDKDNRSLDAHHKENTACVSGNPSPHPSNPASLNSSAFAPDSDMPHTKSDPRKHFPKLKPLFSTPEDLGTDMKRGDFDVLIISQRHGCVVMETKAVGYNRKADVAIVRKKMDQALQQLLKSETVLRHLFCDLIEELPVVKVLAMPNVSREELRTACAGSEAVKQICDCLSASTVDEAVSKILCAEDIVKEDTTPVQPDQSGSCAYTSLMQWWRNVTKGGKLVHREGPGESAKVVELEEKLSRNVFEQMFARLAGPYSKVTVESVREAAEARTVADCVHLTGLRYGRALLRTSQLELLDCQDQFLYLTGPPGSGKTLVLGIKGIEWARKGDHVVVLIPQVAGWGTLVSQILYERVKHFAQDNSNSKLEKQRSRNSGKSSQAKNKPRDRSASCQVDPTSPTAGEHPAQRTHSLEEGAWNAVNPSSASSSTGNGKPVPGSSAHKTSGWPSSENAPSNVHRATVDKTKDREKFVQDLLERYSDRPLRIIMDEGPTKVSVERLHRFLAQSHRRLADGVVSLEVLHKLLVVHRKQGCPVHFTSCASSSQADEEGRVRKIDTAVELARNIQNLLQGISGQLTTLQPTPDGPQITRSQRWQELLGNITTSRRDMVCLIDDIHKSLTSSCLLPVSSGLAEGSGERYKTSVTGNNQTLTSCEDSVCLQKTEVEGRVEDKVCVEDKVVHASEKPSSDHENKAASAGHKSDTDLGNEENMNTDDSNHAGTENSQLPDIDEVVRILDKLVAEVNVTSGTLFNVDTEMGFFAINEVLSLLVSQKQRQDLSVWSSGVTMFYRPDHFTHRTLTQCLRCPPTVQRVLDMVEKDLKDRPNYEYSTDSLQDDKFPHPTDGPEVKLLNHRSHMTEVKDVLDCKQCGDALVDYLLNTLHVGGDSGLSVEDVVISGNLDIGTVRRPLLQTLQDKGIQLQFENEGLTSPPPYPGKMFAVGGCSFQGLEAKVVVFIPDISHIVADTNETMQFRPGLPDWLKYMGSWNRCHLWVVCQHIGKPFVPHHLNRAFDRKMIPDEFLRCLRIIPTRLRGPEMRASDFAGA